VYDIAEGGEGMEKHGRKLGIPYDFRLPTPGRIKERMWNPDDPRVFTPRVYGAGWTINFATLRKKSEAGFYVALTLTALVYLNGLRKLCKKLSGLKGRLGKG
jgi:hypothetical protein